MPFNSSNYPSYLDHPCHLIGIICRLKVALFHDDQRILCLLNWSLWPEYCSNGKRACMYGRPIVTSVIQIETNKKPRKEQQTHGWNSSHPFSTCGPLGIALLEELCNTKHLQVNIDFENEQDMIEKMRVGIALQPIATALFSNSPFRDGKDTGTPSNPILLQMSRISCIMEIRVYIKVS